MQNIMVMYMAEGVCVFVCVCFQMVNMLHGKSKEIADNRE